ncbi:hypothetical protein [Granulicella tundricola]|uniref:hypothetical protein n=1 Tax=Granulicella tundricola TaxID=940615 RepID=UPI0018DD5A47|nr:hypothetical protein [Granulicella tundricola]
MVFLWSFAVQFSPQSRTPLPGKPKEKGRKTEAKPKTHHKSPQTPKKWSIGPASMNALIKTGQT